MKRTWLAVLLLILSARVYAQSCPSAPTLTGPTGTNNATFVTLSWSNVGADRYDVFLGPISSNGCDTLIGTAHNGATSFNPPQLQPGTAYAWKVMAIKDNCPMVRSTCGTFATGFACPTSAPTLTEPANNAVVPAGEITFRWSSVPNAGFYQLWGSIDGGAAQQVGQTPANDWHVNIGPGKSVEWWVRATGPNCTTPVESQHFRFTTSQGSGCPTAKATLVAPPAQSTQTLPVTFEWTAVPDAISYTVIAIGGIGINPNTTLGTTSNTRLVVTALAPGTYSWLVRANFRNCEPTESERRTVTIAQATCPVAPTLIDPAPGVTTQNPVRFSWNPVSNAGGYALYVSTGGEFGRYAVTTETSVERIMPAGALQWYVAALNSRCTEAKSETRSLTVARPTCPDAGIAFSVPINNSTTTSPVTLNWSAVADASLYRIWVSMDGSPRTLIATTSRTEASVPLGAGTATLQVEATRINCPSVISAPLRITIQPNANCGQNPAPSLITPNGTQSTPAEVRNDVTFRWNAATGAAAYRVWVARDDQPFDDIALIRQTEMGRELEPGRYRWFVEALFEGCTPTRSGTAFFNVIDDEPRCPTGTPTILNPPADAIVTSSPVTFTWTAVPGAQLYRVLASQDNGPVRILGTTTDTSLTRPVPPGQISWAVEAVFEECPSTFSPRVTFTTRQSVICQNESPNLLLPANGVTTTSPLVFNWTPVAGAERYAVFVIYNGGVPTAIGETNEVQLLRRLPPGRYEWFVAALFSGCPATTSRRSTFTITGNEECENRRPILLEPANASVINTLPVHFLWTAVPNATSYKLYAARGDEELQVIATTTVPEARADVPTGFIRWMVEAEFANCPPQPSARGFFAATNTPQECRTPRRTRANVVGRALSGTDYTVRWAAVPNVETYELQESTTADFATATTRTVNGLSATFRHEVTVPTQFYYRVRGVSDCNDDRGPYSNVVNVLITPQRTTGTQRHASAEIGTGENIVQTIFLPGSETPQAFSATVDKPWLTVVPASGTVPAQGLTLSVVADPEFLHLGTNTATVTINYPNALGGRLQAQATTVKLPVQVSLVTPVTPVGKSAPPPDALIIPAVAHAEGANDSLFESDIRVTNLGAETMKYQVTFTPSGVEGTTSGKSATIEIGPAQTTALDDVVASLFGSGITSGTLGMLEIRPLTSGASSSFVTSGSQLSTVASSRTYNVTPTGTFGQFIPALPFSSFVGSGSVLSLQQIAQSSAYRTNFGFAEASGNPAELLIKVYDANNRLVKEIPESLRASEHKQINNLLAVHGITDLAEGRVTVEVTNGAGKVTAYASSVDNKTNDPLLVSPVVTSNVSANRYVIPGAAYIDNGFAFWQTDMRVFNAGSAPVTATLTFYPQANSGPAVSKEVTLAAGEIRVMDNVIANEFAQANGAGGQVVVATPENTSIVATARTYNRTSIGTYGQFIPGVTPAEAVGLGERALQVLQVEHSSRFRTNIGLSETTGNAATVEVALIVPETKVTPIIEFKLAANEFRQFSLADFGMGDTVYNARVTVKVTEGSGRVTAYGSSIDAITQDPTYVPAQ